MGLIEIDMADPPDLELVDAAEVGHARLLVRQSGCVRGFIDVPVSAGRVNASALGTAVRGLPPLTRARQPSSGEPISVVICSRDRPDDLRRCLETVLVLDYPAYEVIVVDSASTSSATRELVESLAAERVRYVRLDQPGLSRARNAGVLAAANDLIAFTDDDVVVDSEWLRAISAGFGSAPDVACVTGMVASGQLLSRAQRSMDRRLTWASNVEVTTFRLADPPAAYPLFPFQFGAYGTGASFATRRSLLLELGGFDEALGTGTPTRGCEDLDWFTRVVLSGRTLTYQPDALVWHKHRYGEAEMAAQVEDFRVALGAVLTKLCGEPAARRAMLPLLPRSARHLVAMIRPQRTPDGPRSRNRAALRELAAMARGPAALRRARRGGAATPLLQPVGRRAEIT